MKSVNAYNAFLEHGVLYPSKCWIQCYYNHKRIALFPDQVSEQKEEEFFHNYTRKDFIVGGSKIIGYTKGVYYNAIHNQKKNGYEVYAYDFVDQNNINVTKIDATMYYKKTLLGKDNYQKPVIKISSVKTSKVNKEENEELYNKIMKIVERVEESKKITKRDIEYALEHSGEEYERQSRREYFGSQWR